MKTCNSEIIMRFVGTKKKDQIHKIIHRKNTNNYVSNISIFRISNCSMISDKNFWLLE